MILLMSRTGSNLFSRVDGVGESDRKRRQTEIANRASRSLISRSQVKSGEMGGRSVSAAPACPEASLQRHPARCAVESAAAQAAGAAAGPMYWPAVKTFRIRDRTARDVLDRRGGAASG